MEMEHMKLKMNSDLHDAFNEIKPVCDVLMINPTLENILAYNARVGDLKKEIVQELQQYLLYPLITRMSHMLEVHLKVLDSICTVLEKITINSFEMLIKLELGLLSIIFDPTRPGMLSAATEELKYSVVKCLTLLILNIPQEFRLKLVKNHVPMLAQAIFVCVHIAKMERLRVLRIAAIECVTAHTMTHPQLTVEYKIPDPDFENVVMDNMLASILPGVLAALQDVCVCPNNPTHAVIVTAIDAIHRILCVPMHDKYHGKKPVTTKDFVNMVKQKKAECDTDVSKRAMKIKKICVKRSTEWFLMAGEKLTLITQSLVNLRSHDHYKVRKELAIYCYRVLTECNTTMAPSIPYCVDVLITLCSDDYPLVAAYCNSAVNDFLTNPSDYTKYKTVGSLSDSFVALTLTIPRILNNIDGSQKLSALNLLYGYMKALCAAPAGEPQRLTAALSVAANMQHLCVALAAAAAHDTSVVSRAHRVDRVVLSEAPRASPWSVLQRLESAAAVAQLRACCALLGGAECAELVLDVLLSGFQQKMDCETVYILNCMITSPESTASMAKRMLATYLEHDVWYLPLEVGAAEAAAAPHTLDVAVYNPRAWDRDTVPDLYEGTVETRYTDVCSRTPAVAPSRDAHYCAAPGVARRHLALSCLLTEGVGAVAARLGEGYQPYQLKTLCLILERVGSPYELLHLAGLKAINEIALASGHSSVGDLITCNADYFTHQITVKLKKSWDCQSALQILSVVMEYSDARILNCLYGIVEDVLIQSCDKHYQNELQAYLQTFLAFVGFIRKCFPVEPHPTPAPAPDEMDLLAEVREYVKDTQEAERLLSDSDFEKTTGKSVEEMYKEDMEKKAEEELDYDDSVTNESMPPPQHVLVIITILKRTVNFVTSPLRDTALLALQVLTLGLPLLARRERALLPLVHAAWAPLRDTFHARDLVLRRGAFHLLATLAALSKDFIRNRTVKEILPEVYEYLKKAAKDSYLKDTGSAYRNSQAYNLQLTALNALPSLAIDLGLEDERLTDAMSCVEVYLSNKQPKPLQASAVKFFKTILDNEYTAGWYHLRKFCDNDVVLEPPKLRYMKLEPIVGTPFQPKDKDFETNIKLIFDDVVS